MKSFAVIAGLAASVSAAAYGYPAPKNATTPCETPYYKPTPVYPVETPEYKPYMTTKTYYGLTTYCPGPTVFAYGYKTYTATCATTIIDDKCTWYSSYMVTPPCPTPVKPTTPCPPPPPPTTTPCPTYVAPKPSYPAQFTGAAAANAVVGLGAVAGALAAFL